MHRQIVFLRECRVFRGSAECRDELRRAHRLIAAVLDTVRDSDRAKTAARDEEAWHGREVSLDGRDAIEVAHFVLRALTRPAVHTRLEDRLAADAQNVFELLAYRIAQLGIRSVEPMRIAAASHR